MSDSLEQQLRDGEPRDKPLNEWVMYALSITAVAGGLLAAQGNGLPKVWYLLGAAIGVPVIVAGLGDYVRRHTRRVQGAALVLFAISSFLSGRVTAF